MDEETRWFRSMTKARVAFIVAVLATLQLFNLDILTKAFPDYLGIDLAVFARVLTVPIAELYVSSGAMPFVYPPTAILPFRAIAWMPYILFVVLSAIAFFAAVSAATGRWVAALSLLSHSAFKGLQLGQIPMLLAAAMFAGLRLSPFAGGALWGAIATVKPQLMMFAPFALLARNDWTMLGGMLAGAAASLLVALFAFGFQPWFDWFSAILSFSEILRNGAAIKAVTPAGVAILAGYPPLAMLLLALFIGGAAIAFGSRHVEGEMLVGLIISASLVASPYGFAHDAIGAIPACVVLMLRGHWTFAIPAALIFFGTPVLTVTGMLCLLVLTLRHAIAESKSEAVRTQSGM